MGDWLLSIPPTVRLRTTDVEGGRNRKVTDKKALGIPQS
jgi:hypothetical protein